MPDRQIGDHCDGQHGNTGPCTWDGTKWTRTDSEKACPFDQSN